MKTVLYACDGCGIDLPESTLETYVLEAPRPTRETAIGPMGIGPKPRLDYCSLSCLLNHLQTFATLEGDVQ